MCDQRTIKIKACKPFRSEDIVNYCIAAIMYNAYRRTEVLDEFGAWAPGVIKKDRVVKTSRGNRRISPATQKNAPATITGLQISAGHRSLTGHIHCFDRPNLVMAGQLTG